MHPNSVSQLIVHTCQSTLFTSRQNLALCGENLCMYTLYTHVGTELTCRYPPSTFCNPEPDPIGASTQIEGHSRGMLSYSGMYQGTRNEVSLFSFSFPSLSFVLSFPMLCQGVGISPSLTAPVGFWLCDFLCPCRSPPASCATHLTTKGNICCCVFPLFIPIMSFPF